MNEFRFAEPGWIHLTWLVLAVGGALAYCEFRGRSVLERFVSRLLQPRLVHRPSLGMRLVSLGFLLLAMLLLVVALMRPQWGVRVQRSLKLNAQIMICLDVSRSMLAEDVAPNRLERAKIELDSLLGLLDEGQQVGLIAFAGKATVLCPMTPDFGFLRLILNETEPSSVGRGGTHMGDAIRKAVDGFRDAGDIHRLILLVTDGEDHDSYPLEAAKAAKEKGVKIVSIGFGDESGSKIEITDPETGASSFIKDRNGNDVVSRLDGDTLRDIALQTDGAYIPAGTGALDLEAIYRTHIQSLLRGTTDTLEQTVRNEAYQWPLLISLAFLLVGLLVVTPLQRREPSGLTLDTLAAAVPRQAAAVLALMLTWTAAAALSAQTPGQQPTASSQGSVQPAPQAPPSPDPAAATKDDSDAVALPTPPPTEKEEPLAPRVAYNRALPWLQSKPEDAEKYLNQARNNSGSDGELRYRSLYNLGWLEVARADALLKSDPEQAKQQLQQAVNRFREAVRVRPDADEARYNLEVASRRLLELIDSLAKRDPGDVAKRLDELIQQLRAHQAELQAAVQQTGEEVDKSLVDTYRQQFRQLGVTQRQVIADMQQIIEDARKELDAIQKKPADKQTPEDRLRAGQYTNMLQFADSGVQRLNQSRSLTRRLQGNRAFRRWSMGLSDAKRARDQLRNPLELIGFLVADAGELAASTKTLAANGASLSPDTQVAPPPKWLNREYLQDSQATLLERTKELATVLRSAKPKEEVKAAAADATQQKAEDDPRTKRLLENVQKAVPFLDNAVGRFSESAAELPDGSLETAHGKQIEAASELVRAWELFLDVRRLIELTYGQATMLRQAVTAATGDETMLKQIGAAIRDGNQTNRQRVARLQEMVEFELGQIASEPAAAAAPPGNASAPATPPQDNPERERYERARQLLTPIAQHLTDAHAALSAIADGTPGGQPAASEGVAADTPPAAESAQAAEAAQPAETATPATAPARDPRWQPVEQELDAAIASLEELRRLFFSLVEHLRDTAQRQTNLNDDTSQQAPAPAEQQTPEKIGPLANRQTQLQEFTQTLASALKEQGQQAAHPPTDAAANAPAPDPQQTAAAKEAGKKLTQAADLVDASQKAMQAAAHDLSAQSEKYSAADKPYEKIAEHQQLALQKLLEALALLDQQPPDKQQQQDQKDQQQQSSDKDKQDKQDQSAQQQNLSANQLLQLIRDREAQRREEKKQRQRMSEPGVDKDW